MKQQLRRPAQFADQFGEVSQLTQVILCVLTCARVLFMSRDCANRPHQGNQVEVARVIIACASGSARAVQQQMC